jgi:hypothetical protein
MATGNTVVNIIGVLIQITIIVVTAKYTELIVIWKVRGKVTSITSTSLENRLIIRTIGVVSKNFIDALIILSNKSLWSFPAAYTILTDTKIA